jgi:Nucleotidyltransferase domain
MPEWCSVSNQERVGYSSGWSVEEDADGGFHWSAHGPAGVLRGRAATRGEAEQAAQEAEGQLATGPGRPGPEPARIERVLERAVAWARRQPDIRGLALVGSWARGSARADSDVDLVVLTSRPDRYLADDGWTAALGDARVVHTQAWGPLTERRLLLEGDLEVEVGITGPAWAASDPVDPGTRRVVTDGLRILHDPDGRLAALAGAAARERG